MHQASVGILLEYRWNGGSLICVQAAGKLPCSCYCWNQMSSWGCSPTRNELKLWNPPLLTIPRKAQRAFLEWPTPENTSLGVLCYPPRLCAETEWNTPKYDLPLNQKSPIGKGWPLAQYPDQNPLEECHTGAPSIWTASSLSRLCSQ